METVFKKTPPFYGSGTALVTPFDGSGRINFDMLERLIEFQIENSTDALIVCGTTGECATLSDQEKRSIFRFAVKIVNGRIPVICGTGSNSTKHSAELSVMAEYVGANGLLVVTPYYNKTSQAGLAEHFTAVADSTCLPLIMYNVPSRTGMSISPAVCARLKEHERIVAIKEASSDISHIAKIAEACGDGLYIYSGNDDQTVPILSLGGIGVISVFSNILPFETHELCRLWAEGRTDEALKLQLKYLGLMNALFSDVNPMPVKAALGLMGFDSGACRPPLTSADPNALEKLSALMKKFGLI